MPPGVKQAELDSYLSDLSKLGGRLHVAPSITDNNKCTDYTILAIFDSECTANRVLATHKSNKYNLRPAPPRQYDRSTTSSWESLIFVGNIMEWKKTFSSIFYYGIVNHLFKYYQDAKKSCTMYNQYGEREKVHISWKIKLLEFSAIWCETTVLIMSAHWNRTM